MPTYRKPLISEHEDTDILLFNRIDGQRILVVGDEDWQDDTMIYNALYHQHKQRRIDYIIFPGHERLYQEDGKPYPVTPGKLQVPESNIENLFYAVAERLGINTSPYELVPYDDYSRIYWEDKRNAQMCIHATRAIIFNDNGVGDYPVLRNLMWHLIQRSIPVEMVSH